MSETVWLDGADERESESESFRLTGDGAGADGPGQGTRGSGRRRGAVTAMAVLISLAGVLAYLIVVFQPFADAAGGCGGG